MKAFKEKQKFTPVSLVFETQEELDIFLKVFSWDVRIPKLIGENEDKDSKYSASKISKLFADVNSTLTNVGEEMKVTNIKKIHLTKDDLKALLLKEFGFSELANVYFELEDIGEYDDVHMSFSGVTIETVSTESK